MPFSTQQQKWIEKFMLWSKSRQDIRAAMVIGSLARTENDLANEWSDIDVAFISTKTGAYIQENNWMNEIAPVWSGIIDTGETWNGLAAACSFSVYEDGLVAEEIWQALLEMTEAYRQLTAETAELLGYVCNHESAKNVSQWIHTCYEER